MNLSRDGIGKGPISLDHAVEDLLASYAAIGGINHSQNSNLPSRDAVIKALLDLETLVFPGFHENEGIDDSNLGYVTGELVHRSAKILVREIERCLDYRNRSEGLAGCPAACNLEARETVMDFFMAFPDLRIMAMKDVSAAFAGDPSAKSIEEVILAFPGLEAIVVHRIAHHFWQARIPLLPRIMSEHIHAKVGIDIHPGAKIGDRFFIDHGTGVVIGETTVIGNDVKLYQGVTLGALSVRKEEGDTKRHPTIGDEVTIYSGATILGGKTNVGRGSIVGGNVWLTTSIPPYSRVYLPEGDHLARIEAQFLDKGAAI